MRTERDFIGTKDLPQDALYGIQSARAAENFALHHRGVHPELIRAMVTVKQAVALTYRKLGIGDAQVYDAILSACETVLSGGATDQFITQALQGGAGTSAHMNVNEVLANLALRYLGKEPGEYDAVHPIDDVNRGQSTNDVYPTALRIASILMLRRLSEACAELQQALQKKENEFDAIKKLGRTELMDAVPITLGSEFGSYAQAVGRDRWRLYKVEERLRQVNIGGTAVGTSDTAERKYRFEVIEQLRRLTGIGLASAEYPMDITQNNDVFVEVSGLLKAMAVNLMKIANDLRLMNMGPNGGIGEIRLAAVQAGSTIMPGKVNPVIAEMTMQVSMRVMANDAAIAMAASHGEFELNAFLPLIADSLLESLSLLTDTAMLFLTKCVELIAPNEERCKELLEASYAFAASYIPKLGYDRVSEVIRACGGDARRIRVALEALANNQ